MQQFNVILFIALFTLSIPKTEELLHIKDVPKNHSFQIGERFIGPEIRYELTPYPLFDDERKNDSIRQIAEFVQRHTNCVFEIGNHTDSRGSESANRIISENRAKSIYRSLIDDFAVDSTKLTYKGYGEQFPIIPNDSIYSYIRTDREIFEKLHQMNRRIELKVITVF